MAERPSVASPITDRPANESNTLRRACRKDSKSSTRRMRSGYVVEHVAVMLRNHLRGARYEHSYLNIIGDSRLVKTIHVFLWAVHLQVGRSLFLYVQKKTRGGYAKGSRRGLPPGCLFHAPHTRYLYPHLKPGPCRPKDTPLPSSPGVPQSVPRLSNIYAHVLQHSATSRSGL